MTIRSHFRIFAAPLIIAAATLFSSHAMAENNRDHGESAAATERQDAISKSEARRIVKAYIKEKMNRSHRVGKISRTDNHWKIKIVTRQGIPLRIALVDKKTGELSFKKAS